MSRIFFKEGTFSYKVNINAIDINCRCRYSSKNSQALVFFHGLGCSQNNWRYAFENPVLLEYNLIAFDMAGFGESEKPDDFSYTLEDHGLIVRELLELLSGQDLHFAAHSMGCGVALQVPLPERVKTFICIEGNLTGADCIASRKTISWSFEEFRDKEFTRQKRRSAFSRMLSLNQTTASAYYKTAQSLVAFSESNKLLEQFKALSCRKAYIYGENSEYLNSLKYISDISVYEIAGCGHDMMIEKPAEFYKQMEAILRI